MGDSEAIKLILASVTPQLVVGLVVGILVGLWAGRQ